VAAQKIEKFFLLKLSAQFGSCPRTSTFHLRFPRWKSPSIRGLGFLSLQPHNKPLSVHKFLLRICRLDSRYFSGAKPPKRLSHPLPEWGLIYASVNALPVASTRCPPNIVRSDNLPCRRPSSNQLIGSLRLSFAVVESSTSHSQTHPRTDFARFADGKNSVPVLTATGPVSVKKVNLNVCSLRRR
jgi:hypothetical protein